MFYKCELLLMQTPSLANPDTARSLWITLSGPKPLIRRDVYKDAYGGYSGENMWQDFIDIPDFPYSGKWTLGENSRTRTADTSYTI
jgi:hypothetical protein